MITFSRRRLINALVGLSICGLLGVLLHLGQTAFHNPQWFSGWLLVFMTLFLMVYNLRKKLSFIPLGSNAIWLQLHIYAGLVTGFLFLLHIGWQLSDGAFGLALTLVFGGVCLVGVIGIILSRALSRQLSQHGEQLIFERIPGFARTIQAEAEAVILESVEKTDSTTLADIYSATLAQHFMNPPRSIGYLIRSKRYLFELHNELAAQERFMNDDERSYSNQIRALIHQRHDLDSQYAIQALLKSWLFIHIPLSYSALLMVMVHVTLVYAFGAVS